MFPITPNEPKPYTVRVWRYKAYRDEPFALREDAIHWCKVLSDADTDDYAVEGVYAPDGTLDVEATREAIPWRKDYTPWPTS